MSGRSKLFMEYMLRKENVQKRKPYMNPRHFIRNKNTNHLILRCPQQKF